MNRSGRDSAVFIALALSTVLGAVLFSLAGTARAQSVPPYVFYNNQWGGYSPNVSALNPASGPAIVGTVFAGSGNVHDITLETGYNPTTGRVDGGSAACAGYGNCPDDLNTFAAGHADGHYFALSAHVEGWYLFFDVVGGVAVVTCGQESCAPTPATSNAITALSPLNGSTTASTAVSFNVAYDLIATSTYDQIAITLNDITAGFENLPLIIASTTAGAAQSFATTTILISGHVYSPGAFLSNSVTGASLSAPNSACGAGATAPWCQFSVESNPLGASLGFTDFTPSSTMALATSTCSISNITGCFQNAVVWAFFPSQQMLTQVAQGGSAVKNKPPFGYLFVNIAAIQALNASGTPPIALVAMAPITQYIFQPADTGIASIIFFVFGVWFFLRVRHIQL